MPSHSQLHPIYKIRKKTVCHPFAPLHRYYTVSVYLTLNIPVGLMAQDFEHCFCTTFSLLHLSLATSPKCINRIPGSVDPNQKTVMQSSIRLKGSIVSAVLVYDMTLHLTRCKDSKQRVLQRKGVK